MDIADPPDLGAPPDHALLRDWAQLTLQRTLDRLKEEAEPARFAVFLDYYRKDGTYAEAAKLHKVSETDVTNWLHQLRLRFRDLLLLEIRRTVASDSEVESEIRDLMEVMENIQNI